MEYPAVFTKTMEDLPCLAKPPLMINNNTHEISFDILTFSKAKKISANDKSQHTLLDPSLLLSVMSIYKTSSKPPTSLAGCTYEGDLPNLLLPTISRENKCTTKLLLPHTKLVKCE